MSRQQASYYRSCARTCRSQSRGLRSDRSHASHKKEKLEKLRSEIKHELGDVSKDNTKTSNLNHVDTGSFRGERQTKYQGKMSPGLQKVSTYQTGEDQNITAITNKINELEADITNLTSQINSYDQQARMYERLAASSR